MTYIIDRVKLWRNSKEQVQSLLIKENEISAVRSTFKRENYMRMNTDNFVMTPTYTMLDFKNYADMDWQKVKEYISSNFMVKGCTTIVTVIEIQKEYELQKKLFTAKKSMLNSPIDYIFALKVPLKILTPTLVRICKREKIPLVLVEVENAIEIKHHPWGWIRESLFPYNCPIVPIYKSPSKREKLKLISTWRHMIENEKIKTLDDEIVPLTPLSDSLLCKIGLYPFKGSLLPATELSYNLYINLEQELKFEVTNGIHYDNLRPCVVVHKGNIIAAEEYLLYRPGYGEHLKIKVPSYLTLE